MNIFSQFYDRDYLCVLELLHRMFYPHRANAWTSSLSPMLCNCESNIPMLKHLPVLKGGAAGAFTTSRAMQWMNDSSHTHKVPDVFLWFAIVIFVMSKSWLYTRHSHTVLSDHVTSFCTQASWSDWDLYNGIWSIHNKTHVMDKWMVTDRLLLLLLFTLPTFWFPPPPRVQYCM